VPRRVCRLDQIRKSGKATINDHWNLRAHELNKRLEMFEKALWDDTWQWVGAHHWTGRERRERGVCAPPFGFLTHPCSTRTGYSDEKVANRDVRVWHFVIENGY
jgi:hypothetical protein